MSSVGIHAIILYAHYCCVVQVLTLSNDTESQNVAHWTLTTNSLVQESSDIGLGQTQHILYTFCRLSHIGLHCDPVGGLPNSSYLPIDLKKTIWPKLGIIIMSTMTFGQAVATMTSGVRNNHIFKQVSRVYLLLGLLENGADPRRFVLLSVGNGRP